MSKANKKLQSEIQNGLKQMEEVSESRVIKQTSGKGNHFDQQS